MIIPLIIILGAAIYSGKYVRGVVDFLAAGRVAGRYVISVGDLTSGLSVITLVALVEAKYQTGSLKCATTGRSAFSLRRCGRFRK